MSSETTLSEFMTETEPDIDSEPPAGKRGSTASQWSPTSLRCECGADITEWHTTARARSLVRAYGDASGRVPVCPACIQERNGVEDALATVPKAMANMTRESSIEEMDADRRLEVILREVKR